MILTDAGSISIKIAKLRITIFSSIFCASCSIQLLDPGNPIRIGSDSCCNTVFENKFSGVAGSSTNHDSRGSSCLLGIKY